MGALFNQNRRLNEHNCEEVPVCRIGDPFFAEYCRTGFESSGDNHAVMDGLLGAAGVFPSLDRKYSRPRGLWTDMASAFPVSLRHSIPGISYSGCRIFLRVDGRRLAIRVFDPRSNWRMHGRRIFLSAPIYRPCRGYRVKADYCWEIVSCKSKRRAKPSSSTPSSFPPLL